jgi:hypothetical protein
MSRRVTYDRGFEMRVLTDFNIEVGERWVIGIGAYISSVYFNSGAAELLLLGSYVGFSRLRQRARHILKMR